MKKLFNMKVCLTSPISIMIIFALLFSTIVIASAVKNGEEVKKVILNKEEEVWIPTDEDIAYQDSMFTIIQNTQNDITDIKKDIVYILERLDYEDGSWDSIRYVKGGKIDERRNQ